MRKFTFPIWAKVAAAFAIVAFIVLAKGTLTLYRLHGISAYAVAARDDWAPSARTLGQLRTSVRQYRLAEATLALARSDVELTSDLTALRTAAATVVAARAACQPFVTSGSDDPFYMARFDRAWAVWRTTTERLIAGIGPDHGYTRASFDATRAYYETAAAALTDNIASNDRTARASAANSVRYVAQTQTLDQVALLAVIVTSLGLGAALTRTVSIPLRGMTAAMRRLAARDFTVAIPGVGRRDELGVMATAIEVFRASLLETEELRARQDAKNAELCESEARFRTVFASVMEGIFLSDPATGRFLNVNQRACDLFGYAQEELLGRDIAALSSGVPPFTLENALELVRKARDFGPQTFEWQCKTKDGRLFWSEVCGRFTTFGGRPVVLATVRDIGERKEAERQIRHLARHDVLTGLPNRVVFNEAAAQAGTRAGRDGRMFAVLFLDLDHFKDVNDTLGHPAGDELLRSVALRLRGVLRAGDVVARFGGDEFAMLAEGLCGPADASALATKVIDALEAPFAIQGNDIRIGTSVGIALAAPGINLDSLMSHADVALYRAKADRRGGYCFFDESMDNETRARVRLTAELRGAIEHGQLFLQYQPQIELAGGRIAGVEALVRWRHPERGILGPEEFVPAAESNGLILSLGRTMLREACRQARTWHDAGLLPTTVAVNLSATELHAPAELEESILATLAETGLPPECLEIELTEANLMSAGGTGQGLLERLRAFGVQLAIDDFGTGFSSLDYLRRFPADRVKIARTFVQDIDQPGNGAVVRATIGLARELGMAVIAEGVETEHQVEVLSSWGCTSGQGFYFGLPLDPSELEVLLRTEAEKRRREAA